GVEDFISFESRPSVSAISYRIVLVQGVNGLRLVENTFEMLDSGGAPRLRVAPPFVVGADGVRTPASLSVAECAVDTNPAGPWGRPLVPPGSPTCLLQVSWSDEGIAYPALLDPQ